MPISLVGEPAAGNQLQQEEFTLLVSAPAISIPDVIEVSVEGLEEGSVVRVEDIALPKGVEAGEELLTRDIVSVVAITDTAEEEASALADAEAEVEAAVEKG